MKWESLGHMGILLTGDDQIRRSFLLTSTPRHAAHAVSVSGQHFARCYIYNGGYARPLPPEAGVYRTRQTRRQTNETNQPRCTGVMGPVGTPPALGSQAKDASLEYKKEFPL